MAYDIIGDIHGHAQTLEALLVELGYSCEDGVYRHAERQAVFLGDFIDRGPQQRRVIGIVRPMIESGAALSVMGNHEFNAIAYATPRAGGGYLREHIAKNFQQHHAFLDAYVDADDYHELIDWFGTLPMWLERDAANLSGSVIRKPERSEIDGNLNEQLIVEYYSR